LDLRRSWRMTLAKGGLSRPFLTWFSPRGPTIGIAQQNGLTIQLPWHSELGCRRMPQSSDDVLCNKDRPQRFWRDSMIEESLVSGLAEPRSGLRTMRDAGGLLRASVCTPCGPKEEKIRRPVM
jgi:hypothetical protein